MNNRLRITDRSEFKNKILKHLLFAILVTAFVIPIFGHLGSLPIRVWDESRLALNALEMMGNGNLLVTHFEQAPDLWNTKPPLMIWLQLISLKLGGVSEASVRFPSAIAAFITLIVVFLWAKRYVNLSYGLISILILLCAEGYINIHGGRSGDYDALLCLFTTLSCFSFYQYIENKSNKTLYLLFTFIALAILTKGISALLFCPAFLIYALYRNSLHLFLRNKHFYLGLITSVFVVGSYYIFRNALNPGYLQLVYDNELAGRFTETIEAHKHGFWFYYLNLIDFRFPLWAYLLPGGVAFGLLTKNEELRKITIYLSTLAISYFLIISFAQTKLFWYDLPLFPILSLLAAINLYIVFEFISENNYFKYNFKFNIAASVFLFLVFIIPYQGLLERNYKPSEIIVDKPMYLFSYFMKNVIKENINVDNKYIVYEGYNAHLQFYMHQFKLKNINCKFKDWRKLKPGDSIFVYQTAIIDFIKQNFEYRFVKTYSEIINIEIIGYK